MASQLTDKFATEAEGRLWRAELGTALGRLLEGELAPLARRLGIPIDKPIEALLTFADEYDGNQQPWGYWVWVDDPSEHLSIVLGVEFDAYVRSADGDDYLPAGEGRVLELSVTSRFVKGQTHHDGLRHRAGAAMKVEMEQRIGHVDGGAFRAVAYPNTETVPDGWFTWNADPDGVLNSQAWVGCRIPLDGRGCGDIADLADALATRRPSLQHLVDVMIGAVSPGSGDLESTVVGWCGEVAAWRYHSAAHAG